MCLFACVCIWANQNSGGRDMSCSVNHHKSGCEYYVCSAESAIFMLPLAIRSIAVEAIMFSPCPASCPLPTWSRPWGGRVHFTRGGSITWPRAVFSGLVHSSSRHYCVFCKWHVCVASRLQCLIASLTAWEHSSNMLWSFRARDRSFLNHSFSSIHAQLWTCDETRIVALTACNLFNHQYPISKGFK